MSLFFKEKSSLSLVFDIRDTSVTIAASRFEKYKKPELVYCQNFKIVSQNLADHEKYLASMLKTIDNGIVSIRKNLIKIGNKDNIDKYFFFIGSPWSVSESKMIKISKGKSFEINKSVINKIISGEEENEKAEIESETHMKNWTVLEEKIVQSKINGYKTDVIFGKKAKDLEIELFVSFIPQNIKSELSSFGKEGFNMHRGSRLNSCILSSYSFFRDLYSDKNDFIYIDIGDLITDAYVVRDDVIQANVSIPLGKKEIIKSASIKAKTPEDVLLSALRINHVGDDVSSGETSKIMSGEINIWMNALNESISKTCKEIDMPKDILIMINDGLTGILLKEIKNSKNNVQFNLFNKDAEITNIEENILDDFIANGKIYKNEPYVKMDLVFLDKMINKS